jgi:hypothetical protein
MQDSKRIQDSEDEQAKRKSDMDPVKKGSNLDHKKLMRTPEEEPRKSVYVYDYTKNKTQRMSNRKFVEEHGMLISPLMSLPQPT